MSLDETKLGISVYKHVRINPKDGNNVALSQAQTETNIDIPSGCWNLFRSRLLYDVVTGDPTALSAYAHLGGSHFSNIEIQNSTGAILAQVQGNEIYTRGCRPYYTSKVDFLTRQPVQNNLSLATCVLRTTNLWNPARVPANTAFIAETPNQHYILMGGTESADAYTIASGTIGEENPQLMCSGGAPTEAMTFSVAISLGEIMYDTFCGLDRDWYFGEILNLRVVWAPISSSFFGATASTDPVAGSAVADFAVNINNFHLQLASERNQEIISMHEANYKRGKVHLVPYVSLQQSALGTNTTGSTVKTLSRGDGINLLRVWAVWANSTNSNLTAKLIENVNASAIVSLQSQIDSSPVQPEFLTSADGDLWDYMRQVCEGCSISGLRAHQVSFAYLDSFCGQVKSYEFHKYTDSEMGVPLTSNVLLYQMSVNKSAVALTQYLFFVTQRRLKISPEGSMFV